jgi:hypothetical protein
MKRQFQSVILLVCLCLCINTSAQIFYQDISPDVTLSTWSMKDINIDSSATSVLSYGGAGNLTIWEEYGSQIAINAFSNCQVVMNGSFPAALNINQVISSGGTWLQPGYSILNDGSQGNWIGEIDKYLGVRIKNGTKWLYGWIRLDVNTSGSSVTIKDYACNRTPDSSIFAGQMITGIHTISISGEKLISVYPNPFNSSTTIKTSIDLKNATLIMYNIFGQTTKEFTNISGQEITIHKDNLPCGIYFLQFKTGEIIETIKLIIN